MRIICTPIKDDDVLSLHVGDIVYLKGKIVTARDAAHRRALEYIKSGKKLPLDLRGMAIMHAGPVAMYRNGRWEIIAIGPTSSYRMEPYEGEFIKATGVKMIIGKGMMGNKTTKACSKYKAIYAIYPGGAAAIAKKNIVRVIDVKWLDLGIPEAMWILEVNNFGPLIVMIDAYGRNYYKEIMKHIMKHMNRIINKVDKEINL